MTPLPCPPQLVAQPLFFSPPPPHLFPSRRAPIAGHRTPTPAMAALPRRASTKAVFLHGTTKMMRTTFLSLSPVSILSETNSNLWILRDFIFQPNLDFISNSNFNPFRLLPCPYISLGAPPPPLPMPISLKHKP
jgi:hypothetical protein